VTRKKLGRKRRTEVGEIERALKLIWLQKYSLLFIMSKFGQFHVATGDFYRS
jgi:hypothetical protein